MSSAGSVLAGHDQPDLLKRRKHAAVEDQHALAAETG
jgi:hypothetical protein